MTRRFAALDGWRGIAAMLGVLYHWPLYGHLYSNPALRNVYLFVDFFFVLSGFVISFAYADRITNPRAAMVFLFRRFGRLWPLHAAMLAIFIGLEFVKMAATGYGLHFRHEAFTGPHNLSALFANIALIHSLGIFDQLTWNGPSWSISVEFAGYVLFGVVMLLWPRRSVAISVATAIVCWLLIVTLSKNVPVNDITYDYGELRYLLGFSIGHLTYRLYAARLARTIGTRSSSNWLRAGARELFALLLVAAFVCSAGTGYLTTASPAVFAVLVYVFAAERGAFSRLLTLHPIQRLGRWSYSIYLTHLFVITVALELCHIIEKVAGRRLLVEVPGAPEGAVWLTIPYSEYAMDAATLAYLAVVIGFAALMHRMIEVPGRQWCQRLISQFFERPSGQPSWSSLAPAMLRRRNA